MSAKPERVVARCSKCNAPVTISARCDKCGSCGWYMPTCPEIPPALEYVLRYGGIYHDPEALKVLKNKS